MRHVLIGGAALTAACLLAASVCGAGDLGTGDECVLDGDGPGLFLAIDETTNSRLTKLCTAKDEAGVAELVALGKVTVIKSGTRAKIIDRGFFTSEVRILNGDHAGESGIVDSEFLKTAGGAARAEGPKPSTPSSHPSSSAGARVWSFLKPLTGSAHKKAKRTRGSARSAATAPSSGKLRITQIAGKTPQEVEGILGTPTEVTPITNYPDDMPGEYRDYRHGRFTVVVQFYRGHAVGASVDIDNPPAKSAAEALGFVGLSPTALAQTFQTPKDSPIALRIIRWRGTVDGVELTEVSATKSGNEGWVLVAVHFPRSTAASAGPDSRPVQPDRFIVYFKNGKQKTAARYEDHGDTYRITLATGGTTGYSKSMVERIEPIEQGAERAMRTWTYTAGQSKVKKVKKVKAVLIGVGDGMVTLRKEDGKTTTIAMERLSEADMDYTKQTTSNPTGDK